MKDSTKTKDQLNRELREAKERIAQLAASDAERKRAEQALRRAHDGLEIRVRERTAELAEANENLIKEIAERKRAEGRVNTQFAVTQVLAESATLRDATSPLLRAICEGIGWEYGEMWRVDATSNLLRWDGSWHEPSLELGELDAISRETTFSPGSGLPGRVWESGQPAWLTDAPTDADFIRTSVAARMGLHGALAFPIRGERDVTGVMVIFSHEIRQPDHELLKIMADIGSRIGQFTERRRAEQALHAARARLQHLVFSSPAVIYSCEPWGDYRATFISENVTPQLGYEAREFVEDPRFWADRIHSEDAPRVFADLPRLFERSHHSHEYRFLHMDGTYRWMYDELMLLRGPDGNPLEIVGFWIDITERKNAEEALGKYAERLKVVQEIDRAILAAQSPEALAQAALPHIWQLVPCKRVCLAVFDLKAEEATVLAVHPRGETRLGAGARFSLEEFGIAEEPRQGEVHVVKDVLALPRPPRVNQTLLAEGVRSCINVPLISQGELIGSLNLGADSPDAFTPEHIEVACEVANSLAVAIQQAHLHEQVQRHAAEMERRVAERTAALREINAELEAFAYSVTHDLRAPLRHMEGFGQALLEDYADTLDPVGQDYVGRITAAAQYMDTLIQHLLGYSRLSRADLTLWPIGLESVVADVLAQLEGELKERKARVTVEKPLPEVIGHPSTLVQVVANLVTNAVKFVASGVTPQVRIWAEEGEPWVRLWVEDNGIGIEPEHQDRIFRVFERLQGIEAYPGTGIGLALVHKGVECMRGRVGVESAVGQGSRFWIELSKDQMVEEEKE